MLTKAPVAESEPVIQAVIAVVLDSKTVRYQIDKVLPDLVFLDWMLPDMSCVDFARRLQTDARTRNVPIIILTTHGNEDDKVGLTTGDDDYVAKSFSPKELVAHIQALLRRQRSQTVEDAIEVNGLRLDPITHRVSVAGRAVKLRPVEFRLLHFLMTHSEQVHSRVQLLDQVWGDHDHALVDGRTVDSNIRRLRVALKATGHDTMIQSVRSIGYRFSAESEGK